VLNRRILTYEWEALSASGAHLRSVLAYDPDTRFHALLQPCINRLCLRLRQIERALHTDPLPDELPPPDEP